MYPAFIPHLLTRLITQSLFYVVINVQITIRAFIFSHLTKFALKSILFTIKIISNGLKEYIKSLYFSYVEDIR